MITASNREDLAQLDDQIVDHAVVVDEDFTATRHAGDFGIKSLITLSLQLYDGLWPVTDEPTYIAGYSVTLTDDATNYLQMSDAGIISVTTTPPTGWPARFGIFTALYDFTFASGVLTGWNDWRVGASVAAISLAQILAALDIDGWVWAGDSLTITRNGKSAQIDLT